MAQELLNLTAYELAKKIEAHEVSAREAAEVANARLEEAEGDVHAFVTITPELAVERAERVDARMKNGGVKLWEGVPIAVKDVLSTRGVRTTCGSKILENFEPIYDASALLNYGEDMIVVGKANCDEFAMGSSTENSAYGPSRNPWDLGRVPGGSSGGSAAAVAGHDPCDSTSTNVEVPDYLAELEGGIAGLRVGVVEELMGEGIEPGVREVVERVARDLEGAGAEVGEVSLPHSRYGLSAYYIIAPAEVSSNLARFDGVRYGYRAAGAQGVHEMYRRTREVGFGDEAKRRIMLGTYALSSGYYDAYYAQAQKVRTKIIEDFREAFSRYEVLVSPTSPSVAFGIGEKIDDPLAMYYQDLCTIPVNLAGIPSISVPGGLSEGLPVGVQLMSDHFTEPLLLKAARAVEEVADFEYTLKP